MSRVGKKELVVDAAKQAGVSAKVMGEAFDATLDQVVNNLAAGLEVSLPGIGILSIVERKARTARDPRTGEPVPVPARHAVRFKPSASLKKALN